MKPCPNPDWHGLYRPMRGWRDYVVPESFAHPAKGAPLLYRHIIRHLEKLGLLKKDDTIVDFMQGQGTTNILASLAGYKTIGVELEDHFIKMAEANRAKLGKAIQRPPAWEILKGDAMRLSDLLGPGRRAGDTSPPYGDIEPHPSIGGSHEGWRYRDKFKGRIGYNHDAVGIVSPPYSKAEDGGGIFKGGYKKHPGDNTDTVGERTYSDKMHNFSAENIGNLPDKALVGVTSPPYGLGEGLGHSEKTPLKIIAEKHLYRRYGNNDNQIGNDEGESYLSAMLQVYREAFKSGISPLVTVTKNPTKKGKIRRLDLDTTRLLEMADYRIIDYHRAWLFEEKTQATLSGDTRKEYKGRLSFFKRLSLAKGNVAAQWEDILIAVAP